MRKQERQMMLWIVAAAMIVCAGGFVVHARADSTPAPKTASAAPKPAVSPQAMLPAPSASAVPNRLVIYAAPHPPPPVKGKTFERQAADAIHTGDRRRASAIYTELAQKFPENPAYAAAANTLSRMPDVKR